MPTPTPHLTPLPSPLHEVVVEGQIHPDAKRFTISMCRGNDLSGDVFIAFDGRLYQNAVVRNHHCNGWGQEDRHGGFPFKAGEKVEIRFIVKDDLIQIFVNKQHFSDFKIRLGKDAARNLFIQGDFTIHNISFPGSGGSGQHPAGHSLQDPPVPLTVPIGSISGRKIVVAGVPTANTRFTVNFLCGSDGHNNAMTFDARFSYGNSQKNVVLNTLSGGHWGTEAIEHNFPFTVNEPFEIVFKVKDECFKIIIDDEKFATYPHHIKPEKVTHLNIVGDVKLNYVKV
ncbi:hypothetical protein BsWGS_10938 [Bradybaena similaris]